MKKHKKKSPLRMFLTALFVVVLLGVAAVFMYMLYLELQIEEEPDIVVGRYMSYINEQDYPAMYAMLSEQSQKLTTSDYFITRNQRIYEGIEAENVEIEITAVSEKSTSSDYRTVDYNTTMQTIGGEITFSNQLTVQKNSDNQYKVMWEDNLIFPSLTQDDKVWYETVKATRGNIYDRNGNLLAGPWSESDESILLGDFLDEDEENSRIDRTYPYGELTAHIVGYVQRINAEELEEKEEQGYDADSMIGKSGMEAACEERLKGKDGFKIYIMDADGNIKETLASDPVIEGEDITLTIDIEMQQVLFEQFNSDQACAVAMDPTTGEVLALVSTPSYDPNLFVEGMSTEVWDSLNNNEAKPMFNRFGTTWAPGSTFKPIIGAMGVTLGTLDPDETTGSNGTSWQQDSSWGNHVITTLTTYGDQVNLKNALIYSDNIYFAKQALKMGWDNLEEQLNNLGFNDSLDFLVSLTKSTFDTESTAKSDGLLADSGYGQGEVLMNPVHMASVYTAFINNGNMVAPTLEYSGSAEASYYKEEIFSKEAVQAVLDGMIQVVENPSGTGSGARIPDITIAAKTGTAEIKDTKDDVSGTELGWFTALTVEGTDKPLLVTAMVENVKNRGGSSYVVPKVKAAFEYYCK